MSGLEAFWYFSKLLSGLVSSVLIYYIVVGIYNVYFHPLRHIPGPKAAAAGRFVWALHQRNGTLVHYVTALHNRYGEVVRLAPNEISFISGETAWRDIYTARAVKRNSNPGAYLKDPNWYARTPNGVSSISTASEVDHARQRRLLSHAFSEKALKSQEPIIQSQVDLLIRRLHEHVHDQAKGIVDLVRWYSFTTFDVIADLTFGESFHCLRDRKFHPWAAMAYEALKSNGFISMKQYFPIWARIVFFFKKQKQLESRAEFFRFVENRVAWRMSTETSRQDFMGHILRHQDEKGMTVKEIQSSMTSFMVAGSETTATCLSGATIMLLQHPDKLTTLTDEIRSKFSKNADITIDEVSKLPFLDAVVHEALRVYAPSPTGFPRVVPAGGDIISGHWIPEKTSVYVSQYSAYRSERNFTQPHDFLPERWLGEDKRFANDKFSVWNPWSFGPRNCIGKGLANAEIRLVLAKVLWHFDLDLHSDTNKDWFDQKAFTVWDKPPLYVRLKPVVRKQ